MMFSGFKGMDNRHRDDTMPEGFVRNAVNVVFDDLGRVRRVNGVTRVYDGDSVHSFWRGYFIEGEWLKRFDPVSREVITLAAVGADAMGFTEAAGRVLCGNGRRGFVIEGDTVMPLGVPSPVQQPNLEARDTGGLFGGEYQVAVTYLRAGLESGCGPASRVTVPDGGGIFFAVPEVPGDIDTVAVYVSQVNGDELFLYDEYPNFAASMSVFIDQHLSSVRLESQFTFPPVPSRILTAHYGRLYWADGSVLRYSEPQQYWRTKANNYVRFGGEISLIVSVPGALFVCADTTYRIGNIDTDEGFMQRVEVLPYGAAAGTAVYDERSRTAFWQSHKGFVAANGEGVRELVADAIALPRYRLGTMSLIERDGVRHLVAVSRQGEASNLMDRRFLLDEIERKGNAL
ncbi:MAG: hypothetical protein IBX56_00125 [Methylomicrobium sp.]|nr:hypothetical protein [Methylomicrobium sp.]